MTRVLGCLLLPIILPISLVVFAYQSLFSPKLVEIDSQQRQIFAEDSARFASQAARWEDDHLRKQAQEISECLLRASSFTQVKRGALQDYTRNMRMISEMNLSGRTGAAKLIHMQLMVWDAIKRLDPEKR